MKATRHNGRSGKHGTYDAGITTAELLTEKQIAIYESMLHLIQKDFVKINLNKNNYNKVSDWYSNVHAKIALALIARCKRFTPF